MLDFESCQSLEKLVLDNEICAKVQRLIRGIEARDDFPSRPIFEELLEENFPKLHRVIRQNYNKVGNAIHKHYNIFNIKLVSDFVYVLMKPLEIIFLLTLYTFDKKPENRIATQYLKRIDKERINGLQHFV